MKSIGIGLSLINSIRLQLFLSRYGQWSRRKAADVIQAGRVSVDNQVILQPFFQVVADNVVTVDGEVLYPQVEYETWMLNKPEGVICSCNDPQGRPLAIDFIQGDHSRLYNIGRLDYNSCGLILISNDGELAKKVMHPSFLVEKEYLIHLNQKIDEELLKKFKKGFSIDGIKYRINEYRLLSKCIVTLCLNEGKNREIRRFFEYHKIGIKKLKRLRIGGLLLGTLNSGESRRLSEKEIDLIFR